MPRDYYRDPYPMTAARFYSGLMYEIIDLLKAPNRRRRQLVLEEMTRYMMDCEARGVDPHESWNTVKAETEAKYRKIPFWRLWKKEG